MLEGHEQSSLLVPLRCALLQHHIPAARQWPHESIKCIQAGRAAKWKQASLYPLINLILGRADNGSRLSAFPKHPSCANHLQLEYNALITNVKKIEQKINFSLFSRFAEMWLHATLIQCPRYENSPLRCLVKLEPTIQRCHLPPHTRLYFVIKQDRETMALSTEKRSGMQNIFLQANCKMHEANYPSSAAYAGAGRIF